MMWILVFLLVLDIIAAMVFCFMVDGLNAAEDRRAVMRVEQINDAFAARHPMLARHLQAEAAHRAEAGR